MTGSSPLPSKDASTSIVALLHGPVALTPVTAALVAANLLVFISMLLHGAGLWHSPNSVQLSWGASFGPATKDGEWWRLGTAMFLHFGLVHLGVNLWALWDAGRLVERLYGSLRFVAAYLASGLAGNLLSLVAQGDRAVSGGASGAVFGVYGALLVCLWRERRQVHPVEFRWLFGGAVGFTAVTIALGLLVPGIDNAAHVGGLVAGALIGAALVRPLSSASAPAGGFRWLFAGVLVLAVIALIAAIPEPAYRWRDEAQAREEIRQFLDEEQRIIERWQRILEVGRRGSASFADLAERMEADVARGYEDSFEQLSALELGPAAPSAKAVDVLRRYAQLRGDASHLFAEGLRANDPDQIREALELARRAPYVARGVEPPPAPKR